jgi:methylated-DNA-[protein]-cysteine S-methyltransferase
LEFKFTYYKTPIGLLKITGNNYGISSIIFIEDINKLEQFKNIKSPFDVPLCLKVCVDQLKEYFNGKRTKFSILLNPKGTPFQKSVWKELTTIPFGKTTSYLSQSNSLGKPKAIRAVASANGKNPICIVIPCHRVIGSDGSLTGYAAGIWRKKWLLDHENPLKQQSLF